MAAGEYVSVSSQADAERADLARKAKELDQQPELERDELARIYGDRGVEPSTAQAVAEQMTNNALAPHARDALGLSDATAARPLQAALTSALTFTAGAAAPLAVVSLAPASMLVPAVALASLACLALLGVLGAKAGGASIAPSVLRVSMWAPCRWMSRRGSDGCLAPL